MSEILQTYALENRKIVVSIVHRVSEVVHFGGWALAVAFGGHVLEYKGRILGPTGQTLHSRIAQKHNPGDLLLAKTAHDFTKRYQTLS